MSLSITSLTEDRPAIATDLVLAGITAKSAISMLFRRDPVFTKVGYMLDLRTVFGRHREIHMYQTLYLAQFDDSSLLFSNSDTQIDGDRVTYQRPPEADDFMELIEDRLRRIKAGELECYVDFEA